MKMALRRTSRGSGAVQAARAVIELEARAVASLDSILDHRFEAAVELIVGTQGRVVVTGVGKSGHIGRKFAATLSATCTPSHFVHAGEAAHGDLGTICADDVLIVISNSGNSAELRAVVHFALTNGVPVIGITARADAPLLRQATIRLTVPPHPEACPVQVAPTTSTTMMLALCDALAIAAMDVRGVTLADIIERHPGGLIGSRYMPIESLISADVPLPLVRAGAPLRDAVLDMTMAGKGIAGVVDNDGNLIGAITDGDLRRSFDRILIARAGDVMTHDPKVLPSGMPIAEALDVLQENRITAAFVVAANNPRRPIGLVNIHDLTAAC